MTEPLRIELMRVLRNAMAHERACHQGGPVPRVHEREVASLLTELGKLAPRAELPLLALHSRSQRPGWRVCTVCRHEFRDTGDAIVTVAAWMAHAREMHPAILAPKDRA